VCGTMDARPPPANFRPFRRVRRYGGRVKSRFPKRPCTNIFIYVRIYICIIGGADSVTNTAARRNRYRHRDPSGRSNNICRRLAYRAGVSSKKIITVPTDDLIAREVQRVPFVFTASARWRETSSGRSGSKQMEGRLDFCPEVVYNIIRARVRLSRSNLMWTCSLTL